MNIEQQAKLAKTSRRKPCNEAHLLWMVLGIIIYYGILAKVDLFKIAELGIHPLGFTVITAIGVGGIIAFFYHHHINKKICRAVIEYNLYLRHEQEKIKTKHIAQMKQRQAQNLRA